MPNLNAAAPRWRENPDLKPQQLQREASLMEKLPGCFLMFPADPNTHGDAHFNMLFKDMGQLVCAQPCRATDACTPCQESLSP